MAIGIIGKKIGMTHYFTPAGEVIPVTVVEVGPCAVVQKKTPDKHGYSAVQVGYRTVKTQKLNKPQQGQFKHMDGKAFAVLKEFRVAADDQMEVGTELTADLFQAGERVDVCGLTKGKGFAGNIKRWGFHRGPMKHGSKFHRGVGGVSGSADPSKVAKGKKMPGHFGHVRKTVKGIQVVETRPGENIVLLRGAVPGPRNSMVTISKKIAVK